MWRDKARNRQAAQIADQLRPRGDPLKRRRLAPARPQPNSGKLVEAMFEALNQTSAPMSEHGFAQYLAIIAKRRPRTFAAVLGRILKEAADELANPTSPENH